MTIDTRFALLTDNGDILFPYIKQDRSGREGFALSAPGKRDANGQGVYTIDLEEVVRRVVADGWKVRAKTEPKPGMKLREGSYGLAMKVIPAYWLAPDLHSWVAGAELQPQEGEKAARLASLWPFYKGMPVEEFMVHVGADEYRQVLLDLEDKMTPSQRAMLIGHAAAPDHRLSTAAIASLGGYVGTSAGNLQYGLLARRFADSLGMETPADQIMAIAELPGDLDDQGRQLWQLRAPLVEALGSLGWLDGDTPMDPLQWAAAEAEVAADPQCQDIPATTRQALVNARVGQGEYRRRLMDMWQGKCAVTGCGLADVLIASHAKAWARSSNAERLDPFNGLLLSAAVDKLFDKGHISFGDDGSMLIKPSLPAAELLRLGLAVDARLRDLQSHHFPYLAAHREAHGFEA